MPKTSAKWTCTPASQMTIK